MVIASGWGCGYLSASPSEPADASAAACEAALERIFDAPDDATAAKLEAEADRICSGDSGDEATAPPSGPNPMPSDDKTPPEPKVDTRAQTEAEPEVRAEAQDDAACRDAQAQAKALLATDPWASAVAMERAETICAEIDDAGDSQKSGPNGLVFRRFAASRLSIGVEH